MAGVTEWGTLKKRLGLRVYRGGIIPNRRIYIPTRETTQQRKGKIGGGTELAIVKKQTTSFYTQQRLKGKGQLPKVTSARKGKGKTNPHKKGVGKHSAIAP